MIEQINVVWRKTFSKLSNSDLAKKTLDFKELIKNGKKVDELLPEAFANVREAAKRTLKQRHFDVQLLGGLILHKGYDF